MNKLLHHVLTAGTAVSCLCAVGGAWAQGATKNEDEPTLARREVAQRDEIRRTRGSAEASFATEETACYRRFFVNDCLADTRARKRELMSDLRRQETVLNDDARKRRASAQVLRIDERSASTVP